MPSQRKSFTIDLDTEKYAELIQLAEENSIGKLIDQALAVLHTSLQYMTRRFKLGLIPVNEEGKQDLSRGVVFLNISNV